jgi:hypothetical protein
MLTKGLTPSFSLLEEGQGAKLEYDLSALASYHL